MNPEFTRNVWLELTPLRCWALPGVLVALLIVVNTFDRGSGATGLNWSGIAALGVGVYLVFALWGAFKAAGSVSNEVVSGTWDQQRLAEHRPMELLGGKLFGSTVFDWIGIAAGLALLAVGLTARTTPGQIGLMVLTLALAALWLHSLSLLSSLATANMLRATRRPSGRGLRAIWVIGLLMLLGAIPGRGLDSLLLAGPDQAAMVTWWWEMPQRHFVPLSLAMFVFWTLAGAHRLVRAELQEPVGPLPWIGVLSFLVLYVYPFVGDRLEVAFGNPAAGFFTTVAAVCGLFVYPLLLGERKDVVRLRGLAGAAARRDARALWLQLPLWTFAFLGLVVSLVGLGVCAWLAPSSEASFVLALGVVFAMLMLRDLGWMLAVHLNPRSSRSPHMVVWFFLVVLYALLPLLFSSLGGPAEILLYLVRPDWPVIGASREDAGMLPVLLLFGLPGLAVAWAIALPRIRRALGPLTA